MLIGRLLGDEVGLAGRVRWRRRCDVGAGVARGRLPGCADGVVCASALVNASPLTAATAMIFLSMCASCWAICEKRSTVAGGYRLPAKATREPGRVFRVPSQLRRIFDASRCWATDSAPVA